MSEAGYPVRLEAPDIGPYRRGNRGIDYVTTFEAAAPGPHALVTAVVHGNEPCGAIALDHLFREEVRPVRGKLTLAFVNVRAYERFDPANPLASRYVEEDCNRVWDTAVLDGPRDSAELRRARELRPVVDEADYLLDIHSMQHPGVPLMLAGPLPRGRDLAARVGVPAHVVCDAGHAAGRRLRDYAAFGEARGTRSALLVECGQHWEPASAAVAREVALRFLGAVGSVHPEFVAERVAAAVPAQRVIEVSGPYTIRTDRFRFVRDFRGMEVIDEAGTLIGWDGDEEVRTPHPGCVLIMPGRRLRKGESAVRFGRAANWVR